jgi:NitT/TauT family transport system permease protein
MNQLPNTTSRIYNKSSLATWTYPNHWDAIALLMVLAFLALLALGAKGMSTPYHVGEPITISLDPAYLPYYAFRSVLRMGLALICSLVFTFIIGAAAAKSKKAQRLLIPLIDILQSVPVLGYLSITVVAFIALFPNSILGPECAAVFAIFTAQVWNMTLSFYQSLRTIPHDLKEAAQLFHLSGWQRFWKLDVPFAMPGLLWNAMMSMSGSWFFVVASEAITVNQQNISLPGIGSYIALAVSQANMSAVVYAIIAMFVVILLYDQILFRPLNDWAQKFKFEQVGEEEEPRSWIVKLFRRTKLLRHSGSIFFKLWDYFVNLPVLMRKTTSTEQVYHPEKPGSMLLWSIFLTLLLLTSLTITGHFVFSSVSFGEALHVLFLGSATALRVLLLIVLSSLVWVPIGVWIGLRPRVAKTAQPIIQFMASFPVNLLYPVVVLLIVKYSLNVNIWTSPLMILGAQWYIAFNVIAGVIALPKDLHQAANLFNVRGRLWWQRLMLPGIFPYYMTGAITASGGAWNASIIAETVSWGSTKIEATGLGAYITSQATSGDFPRLALGIGVMCVYVLVINRLLWRPLYQLASNRFRLD